MEACRFRLLSLQRRSSYSFRRFATPPPTFPDGKMEREVLFERGSRFIGRIPLLLSRGTRRVYLLLGGLRPTTSKALSFRIPLVPSLFSSFPFFSSLLLFFLFFFFPLLGLGATILATQKTGFIVTYSFFRFVGSSSIEENLVNESRR